MGVPRGGVPFFSLCLHLFLQHFGLVYTKHRQHRPLLHLPIGWPSQHRTTPGFDHTRHQQQVLTHAKIPATRLEKQQEVVTTQVGVRGMGIYDQFSAGSCSRTQSLTTAKRSWRRSCHAGSEKRCSTSLQHVCQESTPVLLGCLLAVHAGSQVHHAAVQEAAKFPYNQGMLRIHTTTNVTNCARQWPTTL